MKNPLLILLCGIVLASCAPSGSEPVSTLAEIAVTQTQEATVTAALPTATATLSPQQKANKINLPEACIDQFPVIKREKGFWMFAGNISRTEPIITDFDLQIGDLLFKWVFKIEYINASGELDFFYVPGLTFNLAKGQTVIGSNMVNNDGAFLNSPDNLDQELREFIQKEFLGKTYTPTSQLFFGFADNWEVNSALSNGYFNSAITELYTPELIEAFMETGNSSLLPQRLLIIYQNGTANVFCEY